MVKPIVLFFVLPVIFSFLVNLGESYNKAEVGTKQKIISSIFPENLIYENNNYRTTRINEIIELLFNVGKGFTKSKTGINPGHSSLVALTGIEPVSKV